MENNFQVFFVLIQMYIETKQSDIYPIKEVYFSHSN